MVATICVFFYGSHERLRTLVIYSPKLYPPIQFTFKWQCFALLTVVATVSWDVCDVKLIYVAEKSTVLVYHVPVQWVVQSRRQLINFL